MIAEVRNPDVTVTFSHLCKGEELTVIWGSPEAMAGVTAASFHGVPLIEVSRREELVGGKQVCFVTFKRVIS